MRARIALPHEEATIKPFQNLAAIIVLAVVMAATWAGFRSPPPQAAWTEDETKALISLSIRNLPPLPRDTGNAVADDPRAQRFGHRLFFDVRLSANGLVSCATCHRPALRFAEPLPLAVGLQLGDFNTMSLVGVAYSPWFFWDGRKDSLWSQALSPLENPREQGAPRTFLARLIAEDESYRRQYAELFGQPPDFSARRRFPEAATPSGTAEAAAAWAGMATTDREAVNAVFVNIGKAIAAYERLLLPGETPFDRYVQSLVADAEHRASPAGLSRRQAEGLRLFMGKAQCLNCHNGPLFTNHEFHNTGVLPPLGKLPDKGRILGVAAVREDSFNCLGPHSDAQPGNCAELRFARTGSDLAGARKTPSLRNLGGTGPFMHAGQLQSLAAVLDHYNRARPAIVGHNEVKPLRLLPYELKRLEAFLATLAAPLATPPQWLAPPNDHSTISPTF